MIGIRGRGGHLHFIKANAPLDPAAVDDIIARNVDKTGDVIITDESKLDHFTTTAHHNAQHKSGNHRAEEYVHYEGKMCVTTNVIESAFSLFKRGVVGACHQVSVKHLPACLEEMTWRFNNRKNQFLFRDTLQRLLASENLEYKELTAA